MSTKLSNFSFDDVEAAESENENVNTGKEKSSKEVLADAFQEELEAEVETTEDNYDISNTAFALLETDDFIMTDKGIISKSAPKDNSKKSVKDENPDGDKILGKFNTVDDLVKSYTELEKKLGSSSEAVNKLREVEPVLPMLEAMINDDGFLEMAERYFTNPEEQRKALMKSLGLEEGDQFDLENALADPNSKDAKILEKLSAKKNQQARPPKTENSKPGLTDEEKNSFIAKHGISGEDFDSMIEQSKSYKITLDDIYFLINKDKIIEDAKREASKPFKEQSAAARNIGKTRSNGTSVPPSSPEDAFMAFLKSGSNAGIFSS